MLCRALLLGYSTAISSIISRELFQALGQSFQELGQLLHALTQLLNDVG
jgi:hypothetical protein